MSAPRLAPNGRPLAEVYRAAAARVRAGWCRGRMAERTVVEMSHTGIATAVWSQPAAFDSPVAERFCALGALCREGATANEEDGAVSDEDEDTLAGPVCRMLGVTAVVSIGLALTGWNDRVAPSGEVVACALERAADRLEKGDLE